MGWVSTAVTVVGDPAGGSAGGVPAVHLAGDAVAAGEAAAVVAAAGARAKAFVAWYRERKGLE
jgi:hypothetical protein